MDHRSAEGAASNLGRRAATAIDDDPRAATYAHVLRRLTFGPFPGQVAAALDAHRSVDDLIDAMLAAEPLPFEPYVEGYGPIDIDGHAGEHEFWRYRKYADWWARQMARDDAGLHERISWFWHTHMPSSSMKAPDANLGWRQIRTIRDHALGNFGDLIKKLTVDGAMLMYLDGDGSVGIAPNENYARELMELYTLGIGNYTQQDVVAAARALSGWSVYFYGKDTQPVAETAKAVRFDPDRTYPDKVRFLGKKARFDVDAIVDRILQQDACAPFITAKVWKFLVGGEPDQQLIASWAKAFRRSGYEIGPLVETVVRSEPFRSSAQRRARTPIEWHSAAMRAAGVPIVDTNGLEELGQHPYMPPSPAGWPGDNTWLSATQAHARARYLAQQDMDLAPILDAPDLVAAVMERASIIGEPELRTTLAKLDASLRADPSTSTDLRARTLMTAALLSPEFALT